MHILLTGFEPYGGDTINPSSEIVQTLATETLREIELCPLILPVDAEKMPSVLFAALDTLQPDAVISLGQSGGLNAIHLERVGINLLDFAKPDNSGRQVIDKPILATGPAAYFATLPLRSLLARLTSQSIPARLSLSAGSYLCNQALYLCLHHLAMRGRSTPAGFIHLPLLPVQAIRRERGESSMPLALQVEAVRTILRVVAEEVMPNASSVNRNP